MPVFEAVACYLQSDTDARAFFTGNDADLKTLTGAHLVLVIPGSTENLFTAKGGQRYPGLKRENLPCLWIEDDAKPKNSFLIPLRGLRQEQIRDVIAKLADAAVRAQSARELQQAVNPPPNPNPHPVPDNLLVALGKIAGVAGIALGILLTVFRAILRQKFWPQLEPLQAYYLLLGMLVVLFAVALGGMLIWANQVKARRSTINLTFVFGIAVLGVLAFISRPGAAGEGYRVRVTVLNPSGTPVGQAHVWSTLGGEVKQVDGGWEIDIPPLPPPGKRQLTVRAEVADLALRGEVSTELGPDHAPTLTLHLANSGEANIRGTVVDENGDAVANAFVGVAGFETVTTDAHGNFSLAAHASADQDVTLHVEKSGYTSLNSTLKAGGNSQIIVLRKRGAHAAGGAKKGAAAPPALAKTGDAVIDRVRANLAELERLDHAPPESRVAEILAQLFNRPAFYGIREGDWRNFLYPLCLTRQLLEEQIGDFKSNPDTRAKIAQAIQVMVELQKSVVTLYGPNFNLSDHLSRYAGSARDFNANLPPVIENPTVQFFDERDRQIRQIRDLLKSAGFPIQ